MDSSKDEHWLRDFGTYNRVVYWGPLPAAKLQELKLLEKLKSISEDYVKNSEHQSQIDHRTSVAAQASRYRGSEHARTK